MIGAGAVALVALLTLLRFCGAVDLPPAPPVSETKRPEAREALAASDASPQGWRTYLEVDARSASVPTPSVTQMARKLAYRKDDAKHTLSPGDPAIEAAGLRLRVDARRGPSGEPLLVLVIDNVGATDLAYAVSTRPSIATTACADRDPLPYNAMVIAAGGTQARSECIFKKGMSLYIDRIETVELGGLMSWYVSRVPPAAVGMDPRLIKGHRAELGVGNGPCNLAISQSVRRRLERGDTRWRDLIDYHARHRCDSYQFPEEYQAFEADGERELPIVER